MPKAYPLPERLRPKLAKPLGSMFTPEEIHGERFLRLISGTYMVITVGDRVTETVAALGRTPDIQVVDGKENRIDREPPKVPYARLIEVDNPPASLTDGAIEGVREAITGQKPVRVMVHGEEDLMAIPVIALAPVSSMVFYGQPGEGIVAVKAEAKSKSRNRLILKQMGIPDLR